MSEIWAKSNGISLKDHIKDLLEGIKHLPLEKIKLERITPEEFKTLLCYAIFFHDIGKVSPYFQLNVVNNEKFEPEILYFPNIRHNILSLFFINKEKVKSICKGEENLYAIFLSAIAFHHWRGDENEYILYPNKTLVETAEILLTGGGTKLEEKLKEHLKDFEINGEKAENLISFDEELANHIKEGGNLISADVIPPYSLYFLPERMKLEYERKVDLKLWVLLSGFLMRADHFVSLVEGERKEIKIEDIEKNLEEEVNVLVELKNKLGKERLWQEDIIKEYKDKDKNLILIAPTGIGKTELAFAWAEEEKFFYTLPLRVATNQIFERACKYFNESGEKSNDLFIEGNVGLLHSDSDLYLLEKSEISKNTEWEGEASKILELSKHFSLPINICTGDQIFPSFLKYPGYEKIYATLSYSYLIIDEVQAYDPRACAIVVKMIEDIVSLGGKFLLMTATLPEFVKKAIKERIKEITVINLYENEEIVNPNLVKHKVMIKDKDIEDEIEEIIKKAKKGKRILIVLNTVGKSIEVYKSLKEKIKDENILCKLLHSRFTINDRKEKEKEIIKEFKNPKSEDEKEVKILVATQVVEASLDIDADYLFTEICPIDSLIQRMGRVLRRVTSDGKIKNIEKAFEEYYKDLYGGKNEPNVFVYVKHLENSKSYLESGKGWVYDDNLLKTTKEYLEKIKSKDSIIPIKEREKQKIVSEVYRKLEEDSKSKYLQTFYNTLSILDAGYVSENKYEAHEIFREISSISVVPRDRLEEMVEKIVSILKDETSKEEDTLKEEKDISNKGGLDWFSFKREIIANFVINDYLGEYKERNLKKLFDEIDRINLDKVDKHKMDRLKRYCEGIYVVDLGYDSERGLKKPEDSKGKQEDKISAENRFI